jgi:Flp pilus assembly protein TadD
MSRIYDHLKSLETQIKQEKIRRGQTSQRVAQEEQIRLSAAEREEQERRLQAEEQAAQARLHEAAIEEARKQAADEALRAEEHAARLAEETRLAALARERAELEQAERAALAARIEAERQLAAQLEARIEQEKIERAQAAKRAAHEEKLRLATAKREAQEQKLQEAAIEEARKRAIEETRRAEEHTARLSEETRLAALARERAELEQAERAALAARIEAERQLATQIEARIEQEKIERAQAAERAAHEEQLRRSTAEREQQESRLLAEERAAEIAAETTNTVARSMKDGAMHVLVAAPSLPARKSSYKGYFVVVLLVIGAGMAAVIGSRPSGNKNAAELPVGPVVVEQSVPVDEPKQAKKVKPAQKVTPATETGVKHPARVEMSLPRESKSAAHEEMHLAVTNQKQSVEKTVSKDKGAAKIVAAEDASVWESRSSAVREQLKAGAYAAAGINAQTLARDFPERWEPWFWLGTAQLAQGQKDAAETALEHASRLDPKVARVWIQRAIVAQERDDHAAAVRLLNEARELAPNSPQIYLNLGYSNDALNLSAEAEKNYRHFLSLTEGDNSYSEQRKHVIKRLGGKR